ncbi:exopolyphosphatase [Deinococcus ruber]|uniref:Exopolyphosphatase n=2 Tax=Deinococcus ruber TaxID=1848197 RepID=A0A918CK02_9DEIO|nr:exopolyphosphatase [Deinococcus ruber]
MRVAVADVGTNSTHLLVAEARPGGFLVLDALKDRTRLGECLDAQGNITDEGYTRLSRTLRQFRELAASLGVPELRVYATSAMRGAPNGEEVAQRLQREVGVYPQIISGEREGRLTYLGAAGSVQFGSDNLLLDLGGGSLELVRGDARQAHTVLSLPLGSVRMQLRYLMQEPPRQRDLEALRGYVGGMLEPHLDAFRVREGTRVFGSSGTFETLAEVMLTRSGDKVGSRASEERSINGVLFSTADLGTLIGELRRMTPARRAKVPGLDPRRADIIVAGAVVLHTALELVGAAQVRVSEGALREGMLAEYLLEQERWTSGLSARERSVLELAERFGANLAHARQVSVLSVKLLERLETLEVLPPDPDHTARSLLSAAAALHETGQIVAQSSHHKHSAYLIRHAGLRGYDPAQIELIAQIARYHRRSVPKLSHPDYAALPAAAQKQVCQLAAVLRVADGLDRTHSQSAQILDLTRDGRGWLLRVGGIHELELDGVRQKSDLWAQQFGPLRVEGS